MAIPIRNVDLVAYDDRGQAVLLVEVKRSRDMSELWAAQFRRNILAHGTLPMAPFFLIATPKRFYFWRQGDAGSEAELPHFTIDATKELKPYFEKFGLTPEKISSEALELIVFSWLNDIVGFGQSAARQDSSVRWLSESGLLGALGSARIELSAVQ